MTYLTAVISNFDIHISNKELITQCLRDCEFTQDMITVCTQYIDENIHKPTLEEFLCATDIKSGELIDLFYLGQFVRGWDRHGIIFSDGTHEFVVQRGWGFTRFLKDNELHREDGPAVVGDTSGEIWAINGNLHREDGPAIVGSADFERWKHFNLAQIGLDPVAIAEMAGEPIEDVIIPETEPLFLEGGEGWFINGENITHQVNQWMKENDISYPFSDKHLVLFKLTFC